MELKVGDTVLIEGKKARVSSRWAAGRHVTWKLDDGREIVDLHLAVAKGTVQVVAGTTKVHDVWPAKQVPYKLEPLPREDEDLE